MPPEPSGAPATRNRYRSYLSALFKRALRDGHATGNPVREVPQLKENNARLAYLTCEAEETAILEALPTGYRPVSRGTHRIRAFVGLLLWAAPGFLSAGCAQARLQEARQQEEALHRELAMKREAWFAAHARLEAECALSTPPEPCSEKMFRMSGMPDAPWVRGMRPSYTRSVQAVEDEVRRRIATLRFYDEYLVALGRALAQRLDVGEMPPEVAFRIADEAFREVARAIQNEALLLKQNVERAVEEARREAEVLTALAVVWAASASGRANSYNASYGYAPLRQPIRCTAYRVGAFVQFRCL